MELNLDQLQETFKPTLSKIQVNERLLRTDKFTTNAYWMILTEFEPKAIQKLKETSDQKPNINPLIDGLKEATQKLEIQNNIKILGNDPAVELKSKDFSSWVNCYFMSIFANIPQRLEFFTKDKLSTIYVVNDGKEIMGLIMPIRKA